MFWCLSVDLPLVPECMVTIRLEETSKLISLSPTYVQNYEQVLISALQSMKYTAYESHGCAHI